MTNETWWCPHPAGAPLNRGNQAAHEAGTLHRANLAAVLVAMQKTQTVSAALAHVATDPERLEAAVAAMERAVIAMIDAGKSPWEFLAVNGNILSFRSGNGGSNSGSGGNGGSGGSSLSSLSSLSSGSSWSGGSGSSEESAGDGGWGG